jgi:DUF1365 family protein
MVAPAAEHVAAQTLHARHGAVRHAFGYRIDYVLIDPEAATLPRIARNRWGVASIRDRDHGGRPGAGQGSAWARRVLAERGLAGGYDLRLLTQPRWFGHVFNPVSFWFALRGEALVAVIAEVNNTYGDRHNYLCARPGFAPIRPSDTLTAAKVMHVSPFRDVAGRYAFNFDLDRDAIAIRIAHRDGGEALVATLAGRRRPLTAARILLSALRFPLAGGRAILLIHWQALRLARKGVPFRPRPLPPAEDIT